MLTQSENSKTLADFHVYYELDSATQRIGTIRAISPVLLDELGDLPFLRVKPEVGLQFTKGTESPSNWVVAWNDRAGKMELAKSIVGAVRMCPFKKIPTDQIEPQVLVKWRPSQREFNISVPYLDIVHDNSRVHFFVTHRDDPNVMYYHIDVLFYDMLSEGGHTVWVEKELPEDFSVYTKWVFDSYQLTVEE